MTTKLKLPEGTISYIVENINPTRTLEDLIKAMMKIAKPKIFDLDTLKEIPMGGRRRKKVFLIPFNKEKITCEELEKEANSLGLQLADPNTVCALVEQKHLDLGLYDIIGYEARILTQWRNKNNNFYSMSFYLEGEYRILSIVQRFENKPTKYYPGTTYYSKDIKTHFVCVEKENTVIFES